MIKSFKCNNTHQILAAARCGKVVLAETEAIYYQDVDEILPPLPPLAPKEDPNEIIRKKLIKYYGEPNQEFYSKKKSL